MKYIIPVLLAVSTIFVLSGCMTVNRESSDYDIIPLMQGQYVREGDPYTGKNYQNSQNPNAMMNATQQGYAYSLNDDKIIPLMTPTIVKRVIIMPKKNSIIRAPRSYIMMIMKQSDWAE